MKKNHLPGAICAALFSAGVGFILGIMLGIDVMDEDERERLADADLAPEGFDMGLTRIDMGCIRVPEEEKEDEK